MNQHDPECESRSGFDHFNGKWYCSNCGGEVGAVNRELNNKRVTAAVNAMQQVLVDQQCNLPDGYVDWIDLYELADAALIAADTTSVYEGLG